jgi:hypothetical protein
MTGSDMRLTLKSRTGARVGADDREKEDAEAKIQNIEHVLPLVRLSAPFAFSSAPGAQFVKKVACDEKGQGRDAQAYERFRHDRVSL